MGEFYGCKIASYRCPKVTKEHLGSSRLGFTLDKIRLFFDPEHQDEHVYLEMQDDQALHISSPKFPTLADFGFQSFLVKEEAVFWMILD